MITKSIIPAERIEQAIYLIRSQKVMFDFDLAKLYGVTTGNLNKAASRNKERFPADFMFQLSKVEIKSLIFQFGISNLKSQFVTSKRGGTRKLPYVFTEQGVAMLASVLKSKRAALVNVQIIRTFVKLRQLLSTHVDLARKLEAMEAKYDSKFKIVFDAIRQLMNPPEPARRPIGFNR